MKVCIIELMPFPDTVGGGTTHIMNLSKALAKLGHEVHILSSKPAIHKKDTKKLPKNVFNHQIGITHKKFEKNNLSYYVYRLFFETYFIISALKKLNQIKPDIIDCQSPVTSALPARLSKYPFVTTCHGIHSLGFEKLYKSKGRNFAATFLNKVYLIIAKYNVKKAGRIISQGEETLKFYSDLAGNKSKAVLVNNLVDTDFWKYSEGKNNRLIVTVARLSKQKALDKLITAMNDLKGYNLLLAGEGDQKDYLKSIAGGKVKFLGYKTPEECLRLYKKARFTILPSIFEGLPYSILEAMSCGVIPITTKVGDLKELIKTGKNGFLLQNNDPRTISSCVMKARGLDLKKLAKNARETIVQRYGSERVARLFVKTYEAAAKDWQSGN